MQVLTIDFETYWDKQFSLGKLTTEEYVRDPGKEAKTRLDEIGAYVRELEATQAMLKGYGQALGTARREFEAQRPKPDEEPEESTR